MNKLNVIIDVEKCHNCRNCYLATKDEHVGNSFLPYCEEQPLHGHNWIDIKYTERGSYPIVDGKYVPVMCNHCDNPPCMKAAKNGAVSKREDGIVIIDPEKSRGQRQIVDACPYGVVYWNEEKQIPQAWILDAHLFDQGWTQTRAEQVCPTGAFRTVRVSDEQMQQIVRQERLEPIDARHSNTKPRVHYKNLHYYNKLFVAGTVISSDQDQERCVKGALVKVMIDEKKHAEVFTDAFGEFKVDHIDPTDSEIMVRISYESNAIDLSLCGLSNSVYMGVIDVVKEQVFVV